MRNRLIGPALIAIATAPPATTLHAGQADFFDLSLHELLQVEVTSASKKSQPLNEAPAAIFVITAEDLRRSGVTTLPDALRMVPGVQVAQIDANKWAISARGHNGRFANKLLVLMDGRSLYSPLYSSVFWDSIDTVFEDIERIEVIRGPGATLWGANAVNGVINIITRSAASTRGTLVSALAGDEDTATVALRHGGALGASGDYRLYGKFLRRDGLVAAADGTGTDDEIRYDRIGARADWALPAGRQLSVQAEFYQGRVGETSERLSLTPPVSTFIERDGDHSGGFANAQWRAPLSPDSEFSVNAYAERHDREWSVISETRDTVNLDLQYRTRRFAGHDLIVGGGYRYTRGESQPSARGALTPADRSDSLASLFVQDDITLEPDRWVLTLGTKLEQNDYTGTEHQPNLRLRWTPSESQTLWTAVAHAVRTPGRVNSDFSVIRAIIGPGEGSNLLPIPLQIDIVGNESSESETLTAYEFGYRNQVSPQLNLDLALFYNDYDKLRTLSPVSLTCEPTGGLPPACLAGNPTHVLQSLLLGNASSGTANGLEAAVDWQPLHNWRLQLAYSYLDLDVTLDPGSNGPVFGDDLDKQNPQNQLSIRNRIDLSANQQLDAWIRHVDAIELNGRLDGQTVSIPAYTELDLRYAWKPRPGLELALVGRNLLDAAHAEFQSELLDIPLIEVERSYYAQLRWQF